MFTIPANKIHSFNSRCLLFTIALLLISGCTVGPDFVRPIATAPDNWASWRSGDDSLNIPVSTAPALESAWWEAFSDPILNQLELQAMSSNMDLHTAVLHYAQARTQRIGVEAQAGPEVSLNGSVTRQRQSEYGAGTRIIDVIGGDRAKLANALSEPFTLYQVGFDASWELDLWGRVRRSIEASDADIEQQAAMLNMTRLAVVSDVARNYFELRTSQRQIALAREEIALLTERTELIDSKMIVGVENQFDSERQHAELAVLKAKLPGLFVQEGASVNQIALLLGEKPGQLRLWLKFPSEAVLTVQARLPDLTLGLPSEVALRRPDIRFAEARLHSATANIGIAQANLYPSIRLGARFGYESYLTGEFSTWGSRTWSVGPSLNLPLFDHGRRKSVVQLRELEQQEAAVSYQHTVLQAWREIDDALNAYAAEQQQVQQLRLREINTRNAYDIAQARYISGTTDFIAVLDSQRSYLQARRERIESEGRANIRFITVNKAIGNVGA